MSLRPGNAAVMSARLSATMWPSGSTMMPRRSTAIAPDVIFVSTNPVLSALSQLTRTIPIVFTWVSDSVGSGYVTSLARPAGNITGFHNFEPALGGKWLGLLKEIAPTVARIGIVHVPEITANVAFLRVAEAAAASSGITVLGAGKA
jgi:putative ABC transport system substrate-binding protein